MRYFVSILVSFLFVSLTHSQDLNKGLLLHYSFDGNAKDDSGNNYHGTAVNVTPVMDHNGIPNRAYHFDGTAYVDMPNVPELHPDLPVTIAFWLYIDDFNQVLIPFFDTDFSMDVYYGIFSTMLSSSKKIGVGYGDGGSISPGSRRSKGSDEIFEARRWYHVVFIVKGALDMDIYINGCPSPGRYSGTGDKKIKYAGNHGTIGRVDSENTPGPIYYLNGSIDEFYMWDRALTAEEVALLYLGNMNYDIELGGDKILCEGREYPISVQPIYDRITWSTGDTTPTLIVTKPGKYWVEGFKENCFYFRDTVEFKGSKCLKGGCGCK